MEVESVKWCSIIFGDVRGTLPRMTQYLCDGEAPLWVFDEHTLDQILYIITDVIPARANHGGVEIESFVVFGNEFAFNFKTGLKGICTRQECVEDHAYRNEISRRNKVNINTIIIKRWKLRELGGVETRNKLYYTVHNKTYRDSKHRWLETSSPLPRRVSGYAQELGILKCHHS